MGNWSGRDLPSPVIRFLLCLGITVTVCPARWPDLNAFVERYHRNYQEECLAVHQPATLEAAQQVTRSYLHHYNWERPNQALTCHYQPPRLAFPDWPVLSSLPDQVDPDSWLQAIHGQRYRRQVNSQGAIRLDNRHYYVKQALAGQSITVQIDAHQREIMIEHNKQPIKRIAIKGLYDTPLEFDIYFDAIHAEARLDWRRVKRHQFLVPMSANT